jgi:hypothetical protein
LVKPKPWKKPRMSFSFQLFNYFFVFCFETFNYFLAEVGPLCQLLFNFFMNSDFAVEIINLLLLLIVFN